MRVKKWLTMTVSGLLVAGLLTTVAPVAARAADTSIPAQTQVWQGMGLRVGRSFGNMIESIAKFLGVDVSTIVADRQSGKSMVQIAESKGVTEDQLVNYVMSERKTAIDQLVKDGKITQEQADLHNQIMAQRIKSNLERTTVGPNGVGYGTKGNRGGRNGQSGRGYGWNAGTRNDSAPGAFGMGLGIHRGTLN